MKFFHDEEDGPAEPVKGLPERLPEGERILWQGRPSAVALAINAFRLRWIVAYFIGMTAFRLSNLSSTSADASQLNEVLISSLVFFTGAVLVISVLAFAMSRAALFTITNERVVMRYGVAIRKYVNAPFSMMTSARLKLKSARVGDITLQIEGAGKPAFLHLWPFVRPFKFSNPEPMLRGLKDPQAVAQILARAAHDRAPDNIQMELEASSRSPNRAKKSAGATLQAT